MEHASIYELFASVSAANASKVAYRYKRGGRWIDVTWAEHRDVVARVSKALVALGVRKGDRIAILAQTRLEWVQADFGIVNCGGVTVGVYPSNLAPDAAYVVDHSDSGLVFAENSMQVDKLLSERARLPGLRQIVVFDGPSDRDQGVLAWDEFLALGAEVPDQELETRGRSIDPDDLVSLVYTSGTTGVPKGVMLTHRNLVFTTGSASQVILFRRHFVTLLFLPLAHVFARLITYCCVAAPMTVAFAEDIATVGDNLKEIRPDFLVSVPRIYEKVHDRIIAGVEQAGGFKRKLFHWAIGVGRQVSVLQQRGQAVPMLLRLRHGVADRLVFRKLREALGGQLVFAISGAAPLNKTIAEFFHACGVTILEGIGMTENTSFTNVNQLHENKFGTVGKVGPGIEMRVAEDGEVLYRGDNVMKGYFKDPESTAEAVDEQGWLHTGDIGEVDDEGYLKITDRKKDLIITAGGKNVAPQRIERVLRTSRYIAQAMAYGDRRKYITALVTLDASAITRWAGEHGLPSAGVEELAADPKVHELIAGEIEQLNRQLASFESVKRFFIAPRDLTIEDGDLTPTLKLKRRAVVEKYGERMEALYAG